MLAPLQRARCSSARMERACGNGRISLTYASSARSLRSSVALMSTKRFGAKGGSDRAYRHSVLDATSKYSTSLTHDPGKGRQAAATA